ncbi:MAG: hypothetical protein IJ766_10765 [Clostridia bacterium]|nr:hypothetical protein [Clostridia bacterium]
MNESGDVWSLKNLEGGRCPSLKPLLHKSLWAKSKKEFVALAFAGGRSKNTFFGTSEVDKREVKAELIICALTKFKTERRLIEMARKKLEQRFRRYPDVVTIPEFCQMLGGIGDGTASRQARPATLKLHQAT